MKQQAIYSVLFLFLFMTMSEAIANNNHEPHTQNPVTSLNWSSLSDDAYLEQLVVCEMKLQEFKWSKNIWPKENPKPKPAFNKAVDVDNIRAQVLDVLRQQVVLKEVFNFEITSEMLQHDLNRMVRDTKDTEGLNALFALFDNDANTIAQCVSRPYLVQIKLANQFDYNPNIHEAVKLSAQEELNAYLQTKSTGPNTGKKHMVVFTLKNEEKSKPITEYSGALNIALNSEDFEQKLQQLQNNSLQELESAFVYTEVLAQSDQSFKVQVFSWPKLDQNTWFNQQEISQNIPLLKTHQFILPAIPNSGKSLSYQGTAADSWEDRSFEFSPSIRHYHTAVWTGLEMIVWGGYDGDIYLNTGGRYNPATDSWLETNNVSGYKPTKRAHHTAVWTGDRMIIWGGFDGEFVTSSGGSYNPISNTWEETSFLGAPVARAYHTAVWSGTQMIVWGGDEGFFSTELYTGGRFNPFNNTWLATNASVDAPVERHLHTAVWAGNRMIVWGGSVSFLGELNDGGIYNPNNDSWEAISTLNAPVARRNHTAVWTGSEMVIWGGNGSSSAINSGGRYDLDNDIWMATNTINAPVARVSHTAIWSGSEMLVWGGGSFSGLFNSGGRYDPINDSWVMTNNSAGNLPAGRSNHTAVWTGTEMIVWGGINSSPLNSGGRYNPANDGWQTTQVTPYAATGAQYHSAVWTGTEMIVWGGARSGLKSNRGGRYNPISDTWVPTKINNSPDARSSHTGIWTGTVMMVWGGIGDTGLRLNSGGQYNPISNNWSPISTTGNVPSARFSHTAVWTGTEMVVWGGLFKNGRTNTGGRFDPNSGTWAATSITGAVPNGRRQHTAVWTGSEMIVWGGNDGTDTNSGGRYNPSSDGWVATSAVNAPAARTQHTAVWTGSEMIIWGGYDGSDLSSGGRYDPVNNSWLETSTLLNTPAARADHTAVWTGREMIVWGGSYLNSGGRYNPVNNTWLATSISSEVPTARSYHTGLWSGTDMMVWGGGDINGAYPNSIGLYYPGSYYSISGTLSGLNGDQVILQNNGSDDLTQTIDGDFEFSTLIPQGTNYEVTVLTHPQSPAQTCNVSNGTGTNIMADVDDVLVNCVNNSFNVGVTVSGLAVGNSVFLANNSSDVIEVNNNNVLNNFSTPVGNGLDYLITIETQPTSPSQTCSIVPGDETGTINAMDVNVAVECVTDLYNVGVTINGLAAGNVVELKNNGIDLLAVGVNNTLSNFATQLSEGMDFLVTIETQPTSPNQICSIVPGNESGIISDTNVVVVVTCVTLYDVGVTVNGLDEDNFIELTTNSQSLVLISNTSANFPDQILDGTPYAVLLTAQPTSPNQECTITGGNSGNNDGSGTLAGADVTINVSCITNTYFIGGTVSGLLVGNYMVIQNNEGDDKTITSNGAYIFDTPLLDETDYDVQILLYPDDPIQPCIVSNNVAILNGVDVDDVDINCEFGIDLIFRNDFEELLPNQ